MSDVEKLEERVAKLAPEDLARFRAWFLELDARAWDRQIEADAKAGKLDKLIGEAIVTLGVEDLQRSIRFYEAALGLPRVPYKPETIAFFDLGGAQLALFPRDALAEDAGVPSMGQGFRGVTIALFVTSSEDVRALLERAIQAGAGLTREAQSTSWGGFSGYFADPDGHLWEIACDSKTYAKEKE